MPRIIDRYVIREIIPPFLLALLVFTFILIIPFIIDLAETMIAKGVPTATIVQLAVMLLPHALALTIPMALLVGLLVALGRLSSDRQFVSLVPESVFPSSGPARGNNELTLEELQVRAAELRAQGASPHNEIIT